MTPTLHCTILIASFVVLLLAGFDGFSSSHVAAGTGAGCYTCKSTAHKYCKDKFESTGVPVTNCTSGTCRKIWKEVWKGGKSKKEVIRGCGTGLDYGCFQSDYAVMCECTGDLCNTASSFNGRRTVAAAAAATLLATVSTLCHNALK